MQQLLTPLFGVSVFSRETELVLAGPFAGDGCTLYRRDMKAQPAYPPWYHLLNSMQREWREIEIEKGNDPDPYIESLLWDAEKWPPIRKAVFSA